ncbi:hypothetical protein DFH09DRAFT_1199965 [Mycena vulgaris]|nr:hypothetical protein DFH09DRAFT_1199965 [Mycena vulgaris]
MVSRRSKVGVMAMYQQIPPLPDPSNVYKEGIILTLHEQKLPSPPSVDDRDCQLDDAGVILERTLNGRLINCGRHNTQPSATSPTLQIKLVEPLATGLRNMRLAQVWKAECGNETYVARIFDPLYVEDDVGGEDIFLWIAKVTNSEASAYRHLAILQGNLVPRFRGCFLTVVDTVDADLHPTTDRTSDINIPTQRSVYVFLLEYIPGTDILRQQPSPEWPVCDTHRMAVIRAVCVAWHKMRGLHIFHSDFAGRNIVLKTAPSSTEPFCTDSSCKLRFQVPTTLLDSYVAQAVFPIAVIDFEHCLVDYDYNQSLITDWDEAKGGFRHLPRTWFL